MMFNLEVVIKLFHHLIIHGQPIISDDLTWNTISANNLILDKSDHNLLGHISIRYCFNPFGEVINSHQNETMFVLRFGFNHTNHVNSPILTSSCFLRNPN